LDSNELRAVIRHLRKERGWTQKDLSRKSKVSDVVISRIESGATIVPEMITLSSIAKAFGMELAELLSYQLDKEEEQNIDERYIIKEKELTYRDEIFEWLMREENRPYAEFIHRYRNDITLDDLKNNKIRIIKDLT
jgi:transcriptional regulator with XRE-family HTH domain